MANRRRKHWGWGYEDQHASSADVRASLPMLGERLGFQPGEVEEPVALDAVRLPAPRVQAPAGLREICRDDVHARASHALGKSYVDLVRGFRGQFEHPPDVVAHPREEQELERLLEWCSSERVAAIPFGGGTSVVGGVTPNVGESFNGVVSIDLGAMDRLLEVDAVSRSALIQAGATGPRLESQLAEHGLTLRHFPQSFEYATLGGWIATRAAGHFATLWTHIEDLLESARAITPAGVWESRRLPGSGAGPSPDRMLVGSEGTLGVITQAWMRVQPKPAHRASAGVTFDSFMAGADCVSAISQSGLHPSNCRLLDAGEAGLTMASDGSHALLVLGFESSESPVAEAMAAALALCAEHGGVAQERSSSKGGDAVDSWRSAFLGAPYLRDTLVACGVLAETFETAITWERFPALHDHVKAAAQEACGPEGKVYCRFTHVYPDGPAPYFTVLAPARRGSEVEQWGEIKQAVSDVLSEHGATITHHHAVGRDHRPWYERQRPEPFALALKGAKAAVDPAGVLNPGVLMEAP
ncbi:MAG TPA: FAD-binding oxidoreductase [Solirubrobacteraceae bacterium]|jgi:alkyldihydroxyacetonephosphate synthase